MIVKRCYHVILSSIIISGVILVQKHDLNLQSMKTNGDSIESLTTQSDKFDKFA